MHTYKYQLIESAMTLLVFLAIKLSLRYSVKLTVLNSYFKMAEKKDVLRLINLILVVAFCIVLVAIWSVRQEQVLIFASSLLTVFGVALFAEMSILSNITACIILFFQHPVKVGDTVSISHEGKDIEGELIDITYFFVFIKTADKGILSVPNAALLKSSFMILDKAAKKE